MRYNKALYILSGGVILGSVAGILFSLNSILLNHYLQHKMYGQF